MLQAFVLLLLFGCVHALIASQNQRFTLRSANVHASYNNREPSKAMPSGSHYMASKPRKDTNLEGTRLNKCILGLSRRAADDAIAAGQVNVNNVVATCGTKVHSGDVVRFNGKVQHWQAIATAKLQQPSIEREQRKFIYLKYWKPPGVACTSDPSDPSNIIDSGNFNLLPQRLFTVGRLDKDSTGLILLTSDGRVNNALLNRKVHKEKTYMVETDRVPTDYQIAQLASGVVITTPIQRDSGSNEGSRTTRTATVTAKTLPCKVQRTSFYNGRNYGGKLLEFTLIEGRNRQIRRMAEAVGLAVLDLHRTSFAGVSLKGLSIGQWEELDESEMNIIQRAVADTSKQSNIVH